MQTFGEIMKICTEIFNIPITIDGYTFNLFNVLMYVMVGSLLLWAVFKMFDN